MSAGVAGSASAGFWRQRAQERRRPGDVNPLDDGHDDSYFNEEPEPRGFSGGGNAPRVAEKSAAPAAPPVADGDEVDPLDAFMAQIDAEVAKTSGGSGDTASKQKSAAPWEDLQASDPVADYFEAYTKGPKRKACVGSDAEEEDEEEDEPGDRRNKAIEPLPAVDHSQIKYTPVKMEFYTPHPEIASLSDEQVAQLRSELKIGATGVNAPNPVASFGHLAESLGKELIDGIRRHGFHQPTAIQAQAIPAALCGRDVIGIAETGSGKTVAYLLPMLVHAISQPELKKDEGPIGVVLCPTRELAVQIETEVFKFNKHVGLRSVTLAGGLSKLEQFKEIKRGCEIAICNPGRLIDIVKMKGCNLRRATFCVLDEADRMFHMGFEYQVRSIMQNLRPSRQTLLFSATFPPRIERLARDILHQPIRVTVGEAGQAAENVTQVVEVLKDDQAKWPWLSKRIDGMLEKGQVLIFVKSIISAEELTQNFMDFLGKKTEFLHGDLDQNERLKILSAYRKRKLDVLIATDVAARGLDITTIRTVVSFDVARDIETHTHRVGRTGRAGAAGDAFTLITQDDQNKKFAALLVESLEQAKQTVSEELQLLAMKYGPYRTAKLSGKKFEGKKKGGGGNAVQSTFGLGFDGQSLKKETSQDLEKRLNKEADQLAAANRRIMEGAGGKGGGRRNLTAVGGPAGFVAAATTEEQIAFEKPDVGSDSDDDLFAPGVQAAFGKRKQAPKGGGTAGNTAASMHIAGTQQIYQANAQGAASGFGAEASTTTWAQGQAQQQQQQWQQPSWQQQQQSWQHGQQWEQRQDWSEGQQNPQPQHQLHRQQQGTLQQVVQPQQKPMPFQNGVHSQASPTHVDQVICAAHAAAQIEHRGGANARFFDDAVTANPSFADNRCSGSPAAPPQVSSAPARSDRGWDDQPRRKEAVRETSRRVRSQSRPRSPLHQRSPPPRQRSPPRKRSPPRRGDGRDAGRRARSQSRPRSPPRRRPSRSRSRDRERERERDREKRMAERSRSRDRGRRRRGSWD